MKKGPAFLPAHFLLALGICLITPAVPASAQHFGFGPHARDGFKLGGTSMWVTDPVNPRNKVIRMDVTVATFGTVRRTLDWGTQVEDLTNQLSFNFRFAAGGSCGGGSPRIQLAIDVDGDGTSDGNAFGYTGPFPNFTGCPADTWLFEDLTSNVQRWDLSQFNDDLAGIGQPASNTTCGSFVCTWGQVLTVFGNFPNHRALTATLVDDTYGGSPRGIGFAYYDNIELGDEKLQNRIGRH